MSALELHARTATHTRGSSLGAVQRRSAAPCLSTSACRCCRRPANSVECPAVSHCGATLWHQTAASIAASAAAVLLLAHPGPVRADASMDSTSSGTSIVAAETSVVEEENDAALQASKNTPKVADQVYLSLKSSEAPGPKNNLKLSGRITIKLFDDTPVGAQRFAKLAKGNQGVGYQRSQIDGIAKGFISSSGVRSLSYSSKDDSDYATLEQLEVELQQSKRGHAQSGIVSLIVRNSQPREVKEKLVAYQGKLINVKEPLGEIPNGTAFTISLGPAPELNETQLPIGQVVEGMDLVKQLAALPHVESKAGSPFFQIAKAVGDRRADVAAKGFGRPYQRITIIDSGIPS